MNNEVEYLLHNEEVLASDSPVVTVNDVESCIGNLKRNKAAGADSITSEHLIFGGPSLNVHLSSLFTAMISYSFVPDGFTYGIIIPLLKTKHGDPINISWYNTISCVIESACILLRLRLTHTSARERGQIASDSISLCRLLCRILHVKLYGFTVSLFSTISQYSGLVSIPATSTSVSL